MNLEVQTNNLLDLKKRLDDTGLRYWLMFGTLLGAHRDRGLIPYDKDSDLAIYAEDLSILLTHMAIVDRGGFEVRLCPFWACFIRDGEHTDIHLLRPEGDKRTWRGLEYDVDAFEVYNEIEFLGEKWRTLNEPEKWLEYTYGEDWRIHIENLTALRVPIRWAPREVKDAGGKN